MEDVCDEARADVIAQVNADIAAYDIRREELIFKRVESAPKYRDPETGKTWTGHGRSPMWIKNSPHGKEHFKI